MARKGKLKAEIKDEQERPVRVRRYQYLILIVCEDQKTEKLYFEGFKAFFPERTIYQRTVGTGLDPKGVVEQAIVERKTLEAEARKEVDRTWVVFDKDDADKTAGKRIRYEAALSLAAEQGLEMADSNECFEIWPLLHLRDVPIDIPIPRLLIYQLLEQAIRLHPNYTAFQYVHGSAEVVEIIAEIGDEKLAIQRAKAMMAFHHRKPRIECNPSTRAHHLVEDLRGWIDYFSYVP